MTTLTPPVPVRPAPSGGSLLGAPAADLAAHLAVHGALPPLDARQSLAQVERSGLTGRGGARFPAAVKLAAVAAASHGRAVVVGNGAEGEPGSDKDRQLLTTAPHLVLDGLQIAALITGAAQAILYVRADVAAAVRRCVAQRSQLDRLPVRVVSAAPGFVAGQETAVVSALNGGPARPQFSRYRVTEKGVAGAPTLVQNVETLAHLALIARHGGAWFASTGVPGSTGSFLATVHPASGSSAGAAAGPPAPSVWEVPHGTTLRRLLEVSAGVPVEELSAVLIGGYHGTWVRLPEALDAPLSRDGLEPFGASAGAGVILPITGRACGLDLTAQIVRYLAAESAQQCGPCRFGLPQLARLMSALATGSASATDLSAIRTAAGLVTGRGACHHPDGTARLARSALIAFADDVTLHGHGRAGPGWGTTEDGYEHAYSFGDNDSGDRLDGVRWPGPVHRAVARAAGARPVGLPAGTQRQSGRQSGRRPDRRTGRAGRPGPSGGQPLPAAGAAPRTALGSPRHARRARLPPRNVYHSDPV